MKKNISNSILVLSFITLISACTPKKVIIKAPEAKVEAPKNEAKVDYYKLLNSKNLDYTTLAIRGKAQLNIDGNENNVTLNIRIKKNEKIWFSVTALGGALEAARGIITPDSILVMNRLQRNVIRQPFKYIYEYTNSQINFGWLQSILSGNTIKELMNGESELKQANGVWNLKGQSKDLLYYSLFNTLLKPEQLNLNDVKAGQALKVNYANYTMVNSSLFPSIMKINTVAGKKNIAVSIDFTKIESNSTLDFPFSVPRSYELIH